MTMTAKCAHAHLLKQTAEISYLFPGRGNRPRLIPSGLKKQVWNSLAFNADTKHQTLNNKQNRY